MLRRRRRSGKAKAKTARIGRKVGRKAARKVARKATRKVGRKVAVRHGKVTPAGGGLGLKAATMSEKDAAHKLVSTNVIHHKGIDSGKSLSELTNEAYVLVFPNGPQTLHGGPDFDVADQMEYIMGWARIRDWVEYFLLKTKFFVTGMPDIGGMPYPLMHMDGQRTFVQFAQGDPNPVWPVKSSDPRGCMVSYIDIDGGVHGTEFQRFLAPRATTRYHIGHDCIANHLDVVVAPETGTVIKINQFIATTVAVWIKTNTNLTMILGEVEKDSPAKYGVKVGSKVSKGQPVGRVGTFDFAQAMNLHMVHFEVYSGTVTKYHGWQDGASKPPGLLDPTMYMLKAACKVSLKLAAAPPMSKAQLQNLGRVVMGTSMRH
jgi:hypothetical protein